MPAVWEAMLEWSGKRVGRLTVITYAGKTWAGRRWWCVCDCGTWKKVMQSALGGGLTKSCGCLARDSASLSVNHWYAKQRFPNKQEREIYVASRRMDNLLKEFNATLTHGRRLRLRTSQQEAANAKPGNA